MLSFAQTTKEKRMVLREKQGNRKRVKRKPFNRARIAFVEVKKNLAKPPAPKEISPQFKNWNFSDPCIHCNKKGHNPDRCFQKYNILSDFRWMYSCSCGNSK
jgi:hypothetical protein